MTKLKKTRPKQEFVSIKPTIMLHLALKNFFNKKLRSTLTVLAVVIGVSAIYFLLSFTLGLQDLVTNQVVGDKSLKSIDVTSSSSKIVTLNDTAVSTILKYPHVIKIGVEYSYPGIISLDGGESDAVVYGVNLTYQSLSSMDLTDGRLLEKSDGHSVVLNSSILSSIGIKDSSKAINQQVRITIPISESATDKSEISDIFTIVGVIDSGTGSEIFMPNSIFGAANVPHYNQLKVVVDETANVAIVRSQIESIGFQTSSLNDTLTEIDNIFKIFRIILIGFGSIGMAVAILGMFNTLTISLLERTQEIGLMMALGARRSDVRKLFTLEAVIISFIGSVAGIIIAIISSQIVNLIINLRASNRGVSESFSLFSTPIWSILLVIAATMLIGILVVFYPSIRAERINPIDALRHE